MDTLLERFDKLENKFKDSENENIKFKLHIENLILNIDILKLRVENLSLKNDERKSEPIYQTMSESTIGETKSNAGAKWFAEEEEQLLEEIHNGISQISV